MKIVKLKNLLILFNNSAFDTFFLTFFFVADNENQKN